MAESRALLVLLAALVVGAPLPAQEPLPERPPSWSVLRIAKWSTLALSAGAAVYGFTLNSRADALYEDLEQACVADRVTCSLRTPAGAYQSPDLERRYQQVLDRDRGARSALLASQIGVAASVVLFIIDLRNARPPDDIIYEPQTLQVSPRRDGGVELRLTLPSR